MHCPESGLLTNATNIAKVPLLGSLSWSFAPKYVCFGSANDSQQLRDSMAPSNFLHQG